MIKYALICKKGHEFDSWFASSEAFDAQAKRKLVTCPICGSDKVEKAIMAPRVASGRKRRVASSGPMPAPQPAPADNPVAMMSPQEREIRTKLKELRHHLVKNADNVGKGFAEEARKMHYGETEHRSIYGEASPDQAKALAEEGIDFHPLPILPDDRN